jgi:hypothetical protein
MREKLGILKILPLLFASVVLVLVQSPAQSSAVDCATATHCNDADEDGLTDLEECTSITLPDGLTVFESCVGATGGGCGNPGIRSGRLHPEEKDAFLILERAGIDTNGDGYPDSFPNTNIPLNDLENFRFISDIIVNGGLYITVHEIRVYQAGADRRVTNDKVVTCEGATTAINGLGNADEATPNQNNVTGIIYTRHVKWKIDQECINVIDPANCYQYGTEETGTALDLLYTRHVLAHEFGHMIGPLAVDSVDEFGGHHYAEGFGKIMERKPDIAKRKRGKTVIWRISTEYHTTSQDQLCLKSPGDCPWLP